MSVRSYKVGVVGNNWLVGNAVFSETALRIFLIFCVKLGDYKGRKLTENGSDDFLVFGLKLVLNVTFNLNETYFSKTFAIWRYLTSKLSKNCPK